MGECGFADGIEGGRFFLYKEIKRNWKREEERGEGGRVKFVRGGAKREGDFGGHVWWDLYEN